MGALSAAREIRRTRGTRFLWLVPLLAAVLLAGCLGTASRGDAADGASGDGSSRDGASRDGAPVDGSGNGLEPSAPADPELVEAWSIDEQTRSTGLVVVDGVVAIWECVTNAGEPGNCAVRGRDLASGSVRWTVPTGIDDGVTLVGVGDAVVASGEQTSLVIRASDGDIRWEHIGGVLLGYSGNIVVLAEAGASADATATVVAVDVTSGTAVWQERVAIWEAFLDEVMDDSLRTSVPSGFWQRRHGYSEQLVLFPVVGRQGGAPAGIYETRALANGDIVAGAEEQVYTTIGDLLVHRAERDGKRMVESVQAGQEEPGWSYQLPAGAGVSDCADLVCVLDGKRRWSVVLTPDTGTLVARADGVALARRFGDLAAVLRCPPSPARASWLCRPEQGQIDLVTVADGGRLWTAKRPLFVTQDGDTLLLGIQGETAKVIGLYGIQPGQAEPTHVGDLALGDDPVFRPAADAGRSGSGSTGKAGSGSTGKAGSGSTGNAATLEGLPAPADDHPWHPGPSQPSAYGLECAAGQGLLVCGPRWKTGEIIAWRYRLG